MMRGRHVWYPALGLCLIAAPVRAQRPATVRVRVASGIGSARPIDDVVVRIGAVAATTDDDGDAILRIALGRPLAARLIATKIGYAPDSVPLTLRPGTDTTVTVTLTAVASVLDRVTVSATRSGGSAADEPTRVQVVGGDDVHEQAVASPGGLGALLSETRGVRVPTTGATLGTAAVRLQGLRGQYSLVLNDGLPLAGASTDGLGLLQRPPVDIGQVEVITGVASALYGPAALGGIVDLISRRPTPETDLLVAQTTQDGTDAVAWTADSLSPRLGYSLLAGLHRQSRRDVNGDGWADVPGYQRAVVRPRLFWSGASGATGLLTAGATLEHRTAGTLTGRDAPDGAPFPVSADTRRFDVGIQGTVPIAGGTSIAVRGSGSESILTREFGVLGERDRLTNVFAEGSITTRALPRQVAVAGAAIQVDAARVPGLAGFGYQYTVPGVFVQDTYTPVDALSLTASARADWHNVYGTFVSPRVAALVRVGGDWTVRLSGGTGFAAPTAFTEETSGLSLHGLEAPRGLGAERGASAALDVDGYVVRTDEGGLELTVTVFGSQVAHPVVLRETPDSAGLLALVALPRPTRTGGTDVVAHWRGGEDFDLIATYSYVRAREPDPVTGVPRDVPLTPRHSGGLDARIELPSGTRFGAEAYYTGRQALEVDPYRGEGRPYVTFGLLIGQRLGRFELFADAEDLTNVRQTHWDPLLLPRVAPGGRWTSDVWAPLAGRIVNVGLQVRLGRRL